MKTKITLLFIAVAIICLAQINNSTMMNTALPPPYDAKIPPPINLGLAYDKAVLKLGADTNQFHCVSATCLPKLWAHGSSEDPTGTDVGWTFVFLDTNGIQRNVYVYFDKASTTLVRDPNKQGF
jgi:hypothetical protein